MIVRPARHGRAPTDTGPTATRRNRSLWLAGPLGATSARGRLDRQVTVRSALLGGVLPGGRSLTGSRCGKRRLSAGRRLVKHALVRRPRRPDQSLTNRWHCHSVGSKVTARFGPGDQGGTDDGKTANVKPRL
jgi:hypothetical protein